MADLIATYDAFRGLLVPDPRITLDTASTSVTQAGPLPGVPVAQQDTEMELRAAGSQAAGAQLRVRTNHPGMPGPDGAGFLWQYEGDTSWRGWDVPNVLTSWEAVAWVTGASPVQPAYPHALTLADGTVLVAYGAESSAATADVVRVQSRAPSTGTWASAVTVYDHGSYYDSYIEARPRLFALPSGRVLCYYWVELSNGNAQIQMSYSDDSGATWAVGARYVLPADLVYEAQNVTATANTYSHFNDFAVAYSGGQVVLFIALRLAELAVGAGNCRDIIAQYASNDLGATFTRVSISTAANAAAGFCGASPDVLPCGTGFLFGFARALSTTTADCTPVGAYLPTAFDDWQDQEAIELYTSVSGDPLSTTNNSTIDGAGTGFFIDEADLCLCADELSTFYCVYRNVTGSGVENQCLVTRSREPTSGAVGAWEHLGQSAFNVSMGPWWHALAAGDYPRWLAATWQHGRMLVLHQWAASTGTNDPSIGCAYLGGFSTVTMPSYSSAYDREARANFEVTYLPIELPANCGWTGSGAGTLALTNGALNISTAAASALSTINPGGTVAEGMIIRGSLATVTSAHLSAAVVARFRVADGVAEYEVTLRLGQTAISVRDEHHTGGVGTTIGTTTIDVTAGVDFLVAIAGSSMVTYFRSRSTLSDREWTAGPTTAALTDAATYTAPAANHRIQWGHASSTAESNWYELHYTSDEWAGQQLIGRTYPQDLNHRPYGTSHTYSDGGTLIQAVDGPTYIGDEFDIDTRYTYELARCLPSGPASTRIRWRSTGETQQVITLALDEGLVAMAQRTGNVLIGIALLGCKGVRTGSVRGRAAGGAYSTITTFDAASGLADLDYNRFGNSIESATGGSDSPYLYLNEAAGWAVDLGGGFLRRVSWSTSGKWNDTTTGKVPHLYLEGVTDSEPSSGTLALVPSDFVILMRVNLGSYRALQIIIDAQDTVDGYFEVGAIVPGFVEVHGDEVSWGRIIETTPNVERSVARDGTDRVRVAGPATRSVRYAWTDGIDMTAALGAEPTPPWLTTSTTAGAQAAASVGDTPYQMDGLLRLLDGSKLPLVYLPRIAKGSTGNDVEILNRRHQFVYGRLVSPVRIESIQGDEGEDEVVRVAQIEIQELA